VIQTSQKLKTTTQKTENQPNSPQKPPKFRFPLNATDTSCATIQRNPQPVLSAAEGVIEGKGQLTS